MTTPVWSILYLPAETDDGELLWPEKFGRPELDNARRQMGTALYNCMFLGKPEGLAGEVFRPHWFRLCTLRLHQGGWDIVLGDEENQTIIPSEQFIVYQAYDLAISAKEKADFTVCLTLALDTETQNLFVLDVTRGHWTFNQTQQNMERLAEPWNPTCIGIENIAYQAAAVQEARRNLPYPIIEAKADRDKVTRARLPAALAEAGSIFLVRSMWTDTFLQEISSFPNGAHDDQVDALSIACVLARSHVTTGFLLWG